MMMKMRIGSSVVVLLISMLLDGAFPQSESNEAANQSSSSSSSSSQQQGSNRRQPQLETPQQIMERGMLQLMNASSMEEVINLGILKYNNHLLTAEDLGATINETTGKLDVSGGTSSIPQPDNCSPRDMSVAIQGLGQTALSRVYPSCVRVPRCGGCCGAKDTACIPVYKEKRRYTVLEVTVLESSMTVMSNRDIEVEHHLTCECQCQLSDEKCGPLKNFDPYQCTCTCKDQSVRCLPPYIFSPETCGCECEERLQCCGNGASCDLQFNEQTCSCDLSRNYISGNSGTNITEEDIENHRQRQQAINNQQGQASATTTTTATTTTPTAAPTTRPTTTPSSPCANTTCRRGYRAVFRTGRGCYCQRIR